MKKIISLGIASAVLAMTAISASAAVTINTTDAIETGKTITVTFVSDGEIAAGSGVSFTVAASGVKLEKSTPSTAMMADISDAGKFAAVTMAAQPAGTVLLTQTYTVTATEGQAVSINVSGLEGFADANITPIVTTITAASTPNSGNSGNESGNSGSESGNSGTESGNSGTESGNSGSESGNSGNSGNTGDNNPGTGVALAVFPAVIAGAAVVVAKKKRG